MDDLSREELCRRLEEQNRMLDEAESNLSKAGMFGKQLLENNQVLAEKYETDIEESNKRIESLEQTKYNLEMQLESKDHMEKHYEAELSSASDRAKREVTALTERLQMTHANEVQKLKSSMNTMKEDLDLCRLKESQQQEKIKSLEERLESADEVNNRTFTNMTSCMEEQVSTLAEQNALLQAEKLLLTDNLKDSEEIRKQQAMTISNSKQRLEELQEQNDDQHKQCVWYQRELEECKERLEDGQVELQLFKLESQDPNRKGNSLFAEVEVKRQEIEKKLILLKVQHDAMKKRATFHKQRVQELKLQVAHLLLTDDSRVSVSRIKEVQSDLARAQQQNQLLVKKLRDMEDNYTMQPKEEKGSTTSYHEEQARKECDKLQKELKKERMMRIASEAKETEYKQKLYDANMDVNRTKAQLMRLEIKMSDLKEKLAKGQSGHQLEPVQGTAGRLEKIPVTHVHETEPPPADENKENISNTSPAKDSPESSSLKEVFSRQIPGGDEKCNYEVEAEEEKLPTGGRPIAKDVIEGLGNCSRLTENDDCTNGSTRKRLNGDARGKPGGGPSNEKKKAVSISDQIEVIGSEDSEGQHVEAASSQEEEGQSRIDSPSKAKKSRGKAKKSKAPVVHVGRGEQNECKQQ